MERSACQKYETGDYDNNEGSQIQDDPDYFLESKEKFKYSEKLVFLVNRNIQCQQRRHSAEVTISRCYPKRYKQLKGITSRKTVRVQFVEWLVYLMRKSSLQ